MLIFNYHIYYYNLNFIQIAEILLVASYFSTLFTGVSSSSELSIPQLLCSFHLLGRPYTEGPTILIEAGVRSKSLDIFNFYAVCFFFVSMIIFSLTNSKKGFQVCTGFIQLFGSDSIHVRKCNYNSRLLVYRMNSMFTFIIIATNKKRRLFLFHAFSFLQQRKF